MDADAEIDPALGRKCGVAFSQPSLQLGRTAHRVDDARKLDQQPVAGGLDEASLMSGDLRVDHLSAQRLEPAECPLLLGFDQPRISRDIGRQDRRETAGLAHFASPAAKRRPDR